LSAELTKTHSFRLYFFWQFCPLGKFCTAQGGRFHLNFTFKNEE